MSKIIKLSEWPFEVDEQVKLVWIGDPFIKDKKWMVRVYFRSIVKQITKELIVDWPTIHFFCVGRIYTNGMINNYLFEPETIIKTIDLSGSRTYYNERPWKIQGSNISATSRTFSFIKNSKLYILPYIEFIRGVLAIDAFTLRLILQLDGMENYFAYEKEKDELKIYFTNEYSKKLLIGEKIYHLSWLLSNKSAFSMLIQGFRKLTYKLVKGYKLDFLLEKFEITARIKENEAKDKIYISEIIAVKNKEINANQIIVEHPKLLKNEVLGQTKKREFITYADTGIDEVSIDSYTEGASRKLELVASAEVKHEYRDKPNIERYGYKEKYRNQGADNNTRKYFSNDRGIRTLADFGGEKIEKGIEFVEADKFIITGELEEFVKKINTLATTKLIKEIKIVVGDLPLGNHNSFAFLDDCNIRRKCALAKIVMQDQKERLIIEVERHGRKLSMLILKSDKPIDWNELSSSILDKLVLNSGQWNAEQLINIQKTGLVVIRKRHIQYTDIEYKANMLTALL